MSNEQSPKTKQYVVDVSPALLEGTLCVRAGASCDLAIERAECLEGAVKDILQAGIADEPVQGSVAWLCWFALQISGAYRAAAGSVV
ncbi:MAG: hypothetical protein ABIQ70_07025 [Dokdonella sp.]